MTGRFRFRFRARGSRGRFGLAFAAAFAFACVAGASFPRPSVANTFAADAAASALRSLFAAPASPAALFSPSFARDVPPETIGKYVQFYERAIGAPISIERDAGGARAADGTTEYVITAPRGSLRAAIALDPNGTIAALRFHDEISPANADALKRVLAAHVLAPDWFADSPTRTKALARTQKIVDDLHAALGAYVRLETRDAAYVAIFEHGETHAQISADNSGRIVYLSFQRG
jgi:hypothetical protein